MKEIKYIMTTMTENSLIIIDELCRSTSLEEGTALAIAVVEKMAQSSAFIYITTHFTLLTKLYDMYLNVKVWQLETIPSGEDPKTFKLDFKYSLVSGVTSIKRYGVYIVRNIWPDDILKYVDELLDNMMKKPTEPKIVAINEKVRLKYHLEVQFRKLNSRNKLTVDEVNKLLSWYQTELQKLGCSINLRPLSSTEDAFMKHIHANMPQIRHSVLDTSQSFLVYEQNDVEDDLHLRHERMKHIFTPDASISSQAFIPDPETRMTEERLNEIFTPEQSQMSDNYCSQNNSDVAPYNHPNDINFGENDDFSESYQNISNFIRENSKNVHKLEPEINISYDHMSSFSQSSNVSQNAFGPCCSDPQFANNSPHEWRQIPFNQLNKYHTENQNDQDGTLSINLSKDMNDFQFSLHLQNDVARTSTPVKGPFTSQSSSPVVHIYGQRQTFSTPSSNNLGLNQSHHSIIQLEVKQPNHLDGIDLESLRDDLEACSKIFTESGDDFEEDCLNSTYKSLPNDTKPAKQRHLDIMPTVTIIEGPNNTTLSIDEDDLREEAADAVISKTQEPKINIISDIAVTPNGNINVKTFTGGKDLERGKEVDTITDNTPNQAPEEKKPANITNNNEERQFIGSQEILDEPFSNYRDIQEIASDSRDSFRSANDDSYESNNDSIAKNEVNWNQADYAENANESYRSIDGGGGFQRENTEPNCEASILKEADGSYKSLEKYGNDSSSDIDAKVSDDLPKNINNQPLAIERVPEKVNFNSTSTIVSHATFGMSLVEPNHKEHQHNELEEISTNKCVEENQKSDNKLRSSTNVTTSISNASKLRNLDQATSDSSVQEEDTTKKSSSTNNNDKTLTSVSSASKKRNLDDVTTTSSPSDQSKNKSILIKATETTSSQKESDVSDCKRKKKQFSIPRSSENRTTDDSSRSTSGESKQQKRCANPRKFVPPRKLSAKQIREDFREQDRKILESSPNSSNFSKYLEQLIKRPSVQQIQNATHLALIRKTHEGVEVIPAEPARKRRKRSPLRRQFSNENFNMTIFSDRNAVPFENYLNSNVKDYKTFSFNFGATQENASKEKFKFVPTTESRSEYTANSVTKHFVRTTSEIETKGIWSQDNTKATLVRGRSEWSVSSQMCHQQKNGPSLTPDGFYKQNKDDITRILSKYLKGGTQSSEQGGHFNRGFDGKRSIFENTDLNTTDLNV